MHPFFQDLLGAVQESAERAGERAIDSMLEDVERLTGRVHDRIEAVRTRAAMRRRSAWKDRP